MMTKCSKIRLQVGILRTNGPLVDFELYFPQDHYIFETMSLGHLNFLGGIPNHYESTPMLYIDFSSVVKLENFLFFSLCLLKT